MNAIWATAYDWRTDREYQSPSCPECHEKIIKYDGGVYRCPSCGKSVFVADAEMREWLRVREEVKTEYDDCHITTIDDNRSFGCGGKNCVETHLMRNPVTLEWQVMGGVCKKCGTRFIV